MLNIFTRAKHLKNLICPDNKTLPKSYDFFPPGHYHSPIPSIDEILKKEDSIFGNFPRTFGGIELNEQKQLELFNKIAMYYNDLPFHDHKIEKIRYYYENPSYLYSDAICLFGMIRHMAPKRIIEVGSGYSSCVILDTNELFFHESIQTTFIEPYPDLFLSLIKETDIRKITLIPKSLQDIPLDFFKSLESNDILFIDSSHVSKINSDVNYLFFHILPSLNKGVYIHFHDVFYPFEYPKEWTYAGRFWNEQYLLRAFLQYNNAFEIVFFNTFMEHFFVERFKNAMPLCLKNLGGSIWIRKK